MSAPTESKRLTVPGFARLAAPTKWAPEPEIEDPRPVAAATVVASEARTPDAWASKLAARVAVTDILTLVVIVFGTQAVWLGLDTTVVGFSGSRRDLTVSYAVVSLVIVVVWAAALQLFDSRSFRVLGAGAQEYRAIAAASFRVFGLVAILAFLLKLDIARGYILVAFPLGVLVLFGGHALWRLHIRSARKAGLYSSRVLLVGSASSTIAVARELARAPEAGYRVVGACVAASGAPLVLEGADVADYSCVDDTLAFMRSIGADTVVVTSGDLPAPEEVRALSWGLNPGSEHLVVAPSLVGVGGPRIHTRPVAGLPLIHVETPRFEGRKLVAKRAFDIVGSALMLVVLSPLLVAVAILVKMSGPGPIFFSQERVGINGRPFKMLKFRSMSVDAEARLAELTAKRDAGNVVMFKMKDDPRVTRVGKVLRRYSLDELPQLFNALQGSMSIVGPRPPLPHEVERYETEVGRRFLVKPGITGPWQVSGRSSLDWADTVRLDLYYVENWSLTGDLLVLWRTISAVFRTDGAY